MSACMGVCMCVFIHVCVCSNVCIMYRVGEHVVNEDLWMLVVDLYVSSILCSRKSERRLAKLSLIISFQQNFCVGPAKL